MKFLCPVCGFSELLRAAQDDVICPCCGTQFGYHDYTTTHEQLRQRWIAAGARWHSRAHAAPPGWNAVLQLLTARLGVEIVGGPVERTQTAVPRPIVPYLWTTTAKAA
jgi:hypothetical protein